MNDSIIDVEGLEKTFGSTPAVQGMSFVVPQGSICGFLGRNGAGKTTTLKMLMGMARPDRGTALLFGSPVADPEASVAIRRRIGFVSESRDFYPYMTAGQLIRFTKSFFPNWDERMEHMLADQFELPLSRNVLKLSKGMRTQLAMLLALSRGADLLILDEPTDGLDPVLAEDILKLLVSLAAERGITVFFSSHHLADVEQIADRVIIVDHGRVQVQGSLDDLRASYRRIRMVFRESAPAELVALAGHGQSGRMLSVLARENVDEVVDRARHYQAADIDVQPVGLKEIFLETVRN